MSKLADPEGVNLRRRRRAPVGGTSSRATDRLLRDIDDRLGALLGYCELARLKRESGDALAGRMDAAIETVLELSELIGRLRRT
jgi:hypothetical protein